MAADEPWPEPLTRAKIQKFLDDLDRLDVFSVPCPSVTVTNTPRNQMSAASTNIAFDFAPGTGGSVPAPYPSYPNQHHMATYPSITDGTGIVTTTLATIKCDHVMGDETELEDGQVSGFCVVCGDKIKGRRMVGGFGLARLKDALVDALGDPYAMADLLGEIDRVELMLKVTESALRSAYDMIEMARKMVKTIVLPEEDDNES
jgi:hypothetical protein